MKGYLGEDEATARATRGGFLHTDDVGIFDHDRNLIVLGRLSDPTPASLPGGYPRLWEDAIHDHPEVLHAAVITTNHARTGFVQPRPGRTINAAELMSYLKDANARASLDQIVVLAQMPRTFSGKVDRRALAVKFGGGGS